ncbi:MAG TPA: LacI family DNA-binding transcriptional regulator [Gammaproteobacteria bacterium]|nr:LacI family DNA-binding transcriptional regulator [Gammaproteobacteria bacterium]
MDKSAKGKDSVYNRRLRSTEPRRRQVSLSDVARQAGVSTASVSRVINTPERVRPELRARIEAAIRDLGYIPSAAARALVTRKTRAIGAIVPTIDDAIFATGINALQRQLTRLGYTLLLASSEYDWNQEVHEAQTLLAHGVEGLMLIGEAHDEQLYALLERSGVPFINCWTYRADSPYACVGFDNRRAAFELTQYLTKLGHRDIGMIAGITEGNDRARDRFLGVRDALAAIGSSLPPERTVEQPYSIADGRNGLRELLARGSEPPTAIIGGNDILAMGAMFECQAQGLAIPDSLSIAGFDDLSISAHLQPGLTTVRVPSSEMGQRAADFLVRRLSGQPALDHVEVQTSLVVRGTTTSPRTQWPAKSSG